jgi:hypothetical protein
VKPEQISVALAAMEMLADGRTKAKFLIDLAMGNKSGLDAESFLSLEQEMSIRFYGGRGLEFMRDFRAIWVVSVGQSWKEESDVKWLGHATLHFMSGILSDSFGDAATKSMLSEFYIMAAYFADMLIIGNSMASVKKLLREFGEECAKAGCSGYFMEVLDDTDLEHPKELRDAFAEGVIKNKGAWMVLQEFCRGRGPE